MGGASISVETLQFRAHSFINQSFQQTRLFLKIFLNQTINLIQQSRNNGDKSRSIILPIFTDLEHIATVEADFGAFAQQSIHDNAFKYVTQRQIAQMAVFFTHREGTLVHGVHSGSEGKMGKHHCLGHASGATGEGKGQEILRFWFGEILRVFRAMIKDFLVGQ